MADNLQAEAVVSAGSRFVTAETSFGGDTAHAPGCFLGIVSGAEGSRTFTEYVGGAGAVSAGVQRITLASDDPGVTLLTTIDADTGSILTAVQLIDDAIYTDGSGTPSKGIAVMGTDGTNPQLVSVSSSGHVNIADGGNTITVDGTVAATQSGTWNVGTVTTVTAVTAISNALPAGTNIIGKVRLVDAAGDEIDIDSGRLYVSVESFGGGGTASVKSADDESAPQSHCIYTFPFCFDGTNWDRVRGTSADGLLVNLGTNNDVTVTSGTITLAAGTNTNEVVGDAAHGAAVAGNPLLIGLEGRSTDGTAVDSGDVVRVLASLLGKLVTLPYAIPASTWSYAAVSGGITDTADDVAKAAGGAGTRHYITRCQVINGHATVSTEVVIKTAATILWRGFAQAEGGGCTVIFDPPLRGGDNEAINVTNITTGSATYFNLQGYTAAE